MSGVAPDRLRTLAELREKKNSTKKAADVAKAEFEQYQAELFADMQAEGFDSMKLDGVQYVRKATLYGQVQDLDEFRTWCHEHDHRAEDFLKEAVQAARLNELVREAVDNGAELPPGVGFYAREYISVTETN